jgi:hypothetical protein
VYRILFPNDEVIYDQHIQSGWGEAADSVNSNWSVSIRRQAASLDAIAQPTPALPPSSLFYWTVTAHFFDELQHQDKV